VDSLLLTFRRESLVYYMRSGYCALEFGVYTWIRDVELSNKFNLNKHILPPSYSQNTNCYRVTVVCLDAKGLWKPGQSFILAGFALSLPFSVPCGTELTTIDTGCDPALPRDCVDHPTDCNLFKKYNLINFAIIRPSTLNHNRNLWNCRGAPNATTCITVFFSVSQRLKFTLYEIV